MRWLRRIGLVLLILAILLVAWEPTRVGLQTAVMLSNLLDAGPKPLNLFSEAPRRTAVPYRAAGADGDGPEADEDLAEPWLPSWASADRQSQANSWTSIRQAGACRRTGSGSLA